MRGELGTAKPSGPLQKSLGDESLNSIEGALSPNQGRRGKEKLKPRLSRVKRENWMEEKKGRVRERSWLPNR